MRGRESGGGPSFHGDRTGLLLLERMHVCVYVCVRIQGFHRGRHHKIFFSSFFRLGNKEAFLLRKDVIRTIRKRTPTRHVVKHIAF